MSKRLWIAIIFLLYFLTIVFHLERVLLFWEEILAILQNSGTGFMPHGIPCGKHVKIFHGDSVEFYVKKSMELSCHVGKRVWKFYGALWDCMWNILWNFHRTPWNFTEFHGIPENIPRGIRCSLHGKFYTFSPWNSMGYKTATAILRDRQRL